MPSNIIEVYNREKDRIALMALCRVMQIGHLEETNDEAKYKATLREWLPTGGRSERKTREGGNDYEVIVPERFRKTVFQAFEKDCFILAQMNFRFLESAVLIEPPDFYDFGEYLDKTGSQKV